MQVLKLSDNYSEILSTPFLHMHFPFHSQYRKSRIPKGSADVFPQSNGPNIHARGVSD